MNAVPVTDSPEQAAVIHAPADDDVLVVAGAGSGKTYTMTRRIVTLIVEDGVPAERILGLTFTRKAAAELLSRVNAAVAAARSSHGRRPGHDGGAGQGDASFLNPEVMTYDAFFQSMVRQYGLLVGFDQHTQPLSDAGARQLAADVVGEHLEVLHAHDLGTFDQVVADVLKLSNAIASSMIGGDCRDMHEAITRIGIWDRAFEARLDAALEGEEIPDSIPDSKGWERKRTLKARTKKDSDGDYARKREEHRAFWHGVCAYRCAQLRDVVRRRESLLTLVHAYEREKRRRGMAEFGDFAIAAYQLVSRFPSIGTRYRQLYTHVLLDEYQDTSSTQASLLAALFHPSRQGNGPDGGETAPRSAVTAVGDPLQSIYAWRGASPGAFRMFQRDFDMDTNRRTASLSVTRRNSRVVLRAANALAETLRIEPARRSSATLREVRVARLDHVPDAPEGTVGVLGFDSLDEEVEAVVKFAQQALVEHTPRDPGERDHRPHVAVIMRSKTHMEEFAEALRRAGLTTLTVGYSALLARPEIRDVLAVLHAVCDSSDSASLMRLMATPRFAVGAGALRALAREADQLDVGRRFQALVQAGLASARMPDGQWRTAVREHASQVPHLVFLGDVLADGEGLDAALRDAGIDGTDAQGIRGASQVLIQVRRVLHQGLSQVVRAAVQALDLDVDMMVAQALRTPDKPVVPAETLASLEALDGMVDTYQQELSAGQAPSLRGFMAWVDDLDSVDDPTGPSADTPVDVALMTVHQSKGLEWDAVAVVGMSDGGFPSKQGDGLKVTLSERQDCAPPDGPSGREAADCMRIGGTDGDVVRTGDGIRTAIGAGGEGCADGGWRPPQYESSARSWLSSPTAVPVPMRVDRAILPKFPHDADAGGDALLALASLEDVESIDDEVFGSMRGVRDLGEDVDQVDSGAWHLTQEEECGRRLHADERRLAYVAVTRARHDVLLTYSRFSRPDADGGRKGPANKPSNFWQEVHDALDCERKVSGPSDETLARSMEESGVASTEGFFLGQRAVPYMDAVLAGACDRAVHGDGNERENGGFPWPCALGEDTMTRLRSSARAVRELGASGKGTVDGTDGMLDAPEHSLLASAALLMRDDDLMPWRLSHERADGEEVDAWVRQRAERVLAAERQSVTAVQARTGQSSGRGKAAYWRGVVRPIPHVASPAADAGTRLHAWAERFIAACDTDTGSAGPDAWEPYDVRACGDGVPADAVAIHAASRQELLAQVERAQEEEKTLGMHGDGRDAGRLGLWQRRLAQSKWAGRIPVAVERQIVASIPELGGLIVNGKLDAVFRGGLDGSDPAQRLTIVDWKTGVKPRTQEETEAKLAQLDLYRLLLSRMEDVPLERIDATLYYLSESSESAREVHALAKTEARILEELKRGVAQSGDVD